MFIFSGVEPGLVLIVDIFKEFQATQILGAFLDLAGREELLLIDPHLPADDFIPGLDISRNINTFYVNLLTFGDIKGNVNRAILVIFF